MTYHFVSVLSWDHFFNVCNLGGEFTLSVNQSDTIRDVKTKIQSKEGIPVDQQQLLFRGHQLLNDDQTLHGCNIGKISSRVYLESPSDDKYAVFINDLTGEWHIQCSDIHYLQSGSSVIISDQSQDLIEDCFSKLTQSKFFFSN